MRRNGQVMILSVMMLGGILLSGAAIAGLLMLYQIKASNDVVASAKAVFAADTGLEAASWCAFGSNGYCSADSLEDGIPFVNFDDLTVSSTVSYNAPASDIFITARGYAARKSVVRILETVFETAP